VEGVKASDVSTVGSELTNLVTNHLSPSSSSVHPNSTRSSWHKRVALQHTWGKHGPVTCLRSSQWQMLGGE